MNILYKRHLTKLMRQIKIGLVTIKDDDQILTFGNPKDTLKAKIVVKNNSLYWRVFINGTFGAGEAFVNGDWECDNLFNLFVILFMNSKLFNKIDSGLFKITNRLRSLYDAFKINNILRSKQNILKHYDLGNDFFRLFLDKRLMYSCAIFPKNGSDLEAAAEYKLHVISKKIQLKSSDNVLEIGTGWGGFAIYAVENYGCHVTTTTVSDAQYAYVKNLIEQKKLQDKITLLNKDYRLLSGKFDKVVSIEMIEAVGHHFFSKYFMMIDSLLKDEGLFLLQAITINDADYERFKDEVDFIKKYIFPGGCLPSIAVINKCINENTTLKYVEQEDISKHYVQTLMEWKHRFVNNQESIKMLGFNDAFIRKWLYYFDYCASGFLCNHIHDVQMLFKKG